MSHQPVQDVPRTFCFRKTLHLRLSQHLNKSGGGGRDGVGGGVGVEGPHPYSLLLPQPGHREV